jgi:hypothetical protein
MKKFITILMSAVVALAMSACATSNSANCPMAKCPMAKCPQTQCPKAKVCPKCPYAKKCTSMKLTKDMFYKNGKFDDKAAIDAYVAMMENLGYPVSENLRQNMWATDFGLGDFPAVGMGGIFWIHDNKTGIFGHEIILLPNQMLVEHAHFPHAGLPAKYEAWQCRAGTSYCFGEEGEDASKYPNVKVPESQKKYVTVNKVCVADSKKGNIVPLNRKEAFHYQIAGDKGAVVTEYGVYHQNEGNRFTNPNVKF